MKSVFVFGASGRMGQEVISIVENTPGLEYVGGSTQEDPNPQIEKSPDIVIDFSLPNSLNHLKSFIEKHGSALVSGTTGFSEDQFQEVFRKTIIPTRIFFRKHTSKQQKILYPNTRRYNFLRFVCFDLSYNRWFSLVIRAA